MQVSQTMLTPVASITSAVRIGLIDVNPVETHSIIEKSGLKFRVQGLKLEPTHIGTAKDFSEFLGRTIAGGIPIPSWAKVDEFAGYLTRIFQDAIDKDQELKEIRGEVETATKNRGPLSGLHRFLIFIRDKSRSQDRSRAEARRFLSSDLPLWVFTRFVCYHMNYDRYLEYLIRRVGFYSTKLSTAEVRSQSHLSRTWMKRVKQELKPIIDTIDGETLAFLSLITYLLVWNSRTYDDIQKVGFVSINHIDSQQFYQMFDAFETTVIEATEELYGLRSVEFDIKLSQDDSTTRMLRNVILHESA